MKIWIVIPLLLCVFAGRSDASLWPGSCNGWMYDRNDPMCQPDYYSWGWPGTSRKNWRETPETPEQLLTDITESPLQKTRRKTTFNCRKATRKNWGRKNSGVGRKTTETPKQLLTDITESPRETTSKNWRQTTENPWQPKETTEMNGTPEMNPATTEQWPEETTPLRTATTEKPTEFNENPALETTEKWRETTENWQETTETPEKSTDVAENLRKKAENWRETTENPWQIARNL